METKRNELIINFADGIDYDCDCNDTPKTQFWKQFSINFAKAAKGIAFYLGTNRRGGAYWDGTSFARYEIPNLNHEVTKVVAIVLNENTEGMSKSCAHLKYTLKIQV